MNYFQDLLWLFIYSSSALFFTEINLRLVLAFCCTLILICSCYFLESAKIRLILSVLYVAAAVFLPSFFHFYPAALYLLLRDKRRIPAFCTVLLYIVRPLFYEKISPIPFFFGCLAMALAAVLQMRTQKFLELKHQLYSTRDDSQERTLLLAEKNQALLDKQDSQIYTATLRERNRIAREIHDNVGHVLSRSILMVGALKTINTQESMTPMLQHLDTSLNSAMDSIRQSVHDLHDESVNLEESLNSMVRDFTFCPVQLTFDMSREIPREVKYCFISITREAFSNIIRHSHATQVQVIVREHPALYQLCIEDNGNATGLTPDEKQTKLLTEDSNDSGIGLSNMEERARNLGGTFQIIRENGFKIFITIPKKGLS